MTLPFYRPRVADLVFRLFDRPVHPELFDSLAVRTVDRRGCTLAVHITPAGHVLSWRTPTHHLVEVTATMDQLLPAAGRKLCHRFQGERCGRCDPAPGLRYQMSLQVETLPSELFLHVHQELLADGKKGLLFHFRPHHRLGLSPLGVVIAEALPDALSVSAFHTFPDEFTVIKTQSLIERT